MLILADKLIPQVEQLFSSFGTVVTFADRQPPSELLQRADILLVRSVTQVNEALLAQAPQLKFVGTATIGTEHIDTVALAQRDIIFVSAPGANATAVGEYVLSSVLALWQQLAPTVAQVPAGSQAVIIGAGNTGMAAGQRLSALGYEVSYYDPPLIKQPDSQSSQQRELPIHTDWSAVFAADVVSCHVPLTRTGAYPTHHLFGAQELAQLKPSCWLINASRGAVIDEQALILHQQNAATAVVLDVWEFEPEVTTAVIDATTFASQHIAGHSIEGKLGGVWRLYEAVAGWLQQPLTLGWDDFLMQATSVEDTARYSPIEVTEPPTLADLARWVHGVYDIRQDDRLFREALMTPARFDSLRKNYPVRRQLAVQKLSVNLLQSSHQLNADWCDRLRELGFRARSSN